VFAAYSTQHVTYVGTDNHVHELLWDSKGWHHNDLTVAAGIAGSPGGNTATGYVFFCTQHLVYFGDGLNELSWDRLAS
jgi:hypothetical protein